MNRVAKTHWKSSEVRKHVRTKQSHPVACITTLFLYWHLAKLTFELKYCLPKLGLKLLFRRLYVQYIIMQSGKEQLWVLEDAKKCP